MKLEDLLRTLAEDDTKPPLHFALRLALGALAGTAVSALFLVAATGLRPDFAVAAGSAYVQFKFAFAAALTFTAFRALRTAAQPEPQRPRVLLPLVAAPIVVLTGVGFEIASTPASTWLDAGFGTHPQLCLLAVPLLSAAPLAATLFVMRSAAPRSPATAGGLLGLFCGALGALVYMLRCTDDAPLFVACWYTAAVLMCAAFGCAMGRKYLQW